MLEIMGIKNRVSIIEAMRGAASIGVALFHFSGQMTSEIPKLLHSVGWLGVDVFFVISGFVIPLSLYDKGYSVRSFPNFLLRRLVRLEPPYLLSIALTLLLWHLSAMSPGFEGGRPDYSIAQIAFHLFYAIPLTNYPWINPVYWSLAYEFVFYIAVGILFSSLISRPIEVTVLTIAGFSATFFYMESNIDARVVEFGVGVLLMRCSVDVAYCWRIWFWISACLALIFWFGGLMTGVVVFLASGAILFLRDVQCGKLAFFVGGISYSLFLTHVTIGGRVVNLGKRFGEGAIHDIVVMVIALATSILFAVLFARFVEGPALRTSRKIAISALATAGN